MAGHLIRLPATKRLGIALFLLVTLPLTTWGQKTWVGDTNNNWANANNWNPNGVPTATDIVTIGNGYTVNLNTNATVASLTVNGELTIGNNNTARTLSVNGDLVVDASGRINVGNNTVTHQLSIGGNLTVNGTFDLSLDNNSFCNATFNGTSQTISGSGTVEFYTLTNSTGTLTLARNISIANGNLTINGGTFNVSTYTANRTAGGGTLAVAAGATLRAAGTNALPQISLIH